MHILYCQAGVGHVLVVDFMFNATQEQLTDKEEAQMTDMLADEFPSTREIFSFHVSFLLSTVFLNNVVFQFPLGMPTIQFFHSLNSNFSMPKTTLQFLLRTT